jgi:hypothetical protein
VSSRNFVSVLRQTWQREGLRGLYSGFGVAFFASAPAACLYFSTFEGAKAVLERAPGLERAPAAAHFASGLIAETVSCVLWVPIDVVKERLQVQSALPPGAARYGGNVDAIRTILQREGLRGIYKGYGATVASFGPFSAFYLMFYEQFKATAKRFYGVASDGDVPFAGFLLSGAAAGSLASFVTNPLDMAKLRIQVQRGNQGVGFGFNYRHIAHGVSEILRREGFRGLWKGAGARVAFHAPSAAITIAAYEKCKQLWERILRV